jgi:hypothetical protein
MSYIPPQLKEAQVLEYSGGNILYRGEAKAGTAKSAASWRISRFTYSGSDITDVQFADGESTYDKIWDNRASYTYS